MLGERISAQLPHLFVLCFDVDFEWRTALRFVRLFLSATVALGDVDDFGFGGAGACEGGETPTRGSVGGLSALRVNPRCEPLRPAAVEQLRGTNGSCRSSASRSSNASDVSTHRGRHLATWDSAEVRFWLCWLYVVCTTVVPVVPLTLCTNPSHHLTCSSEHP